MNVPLTLGTSLGGPFGYEMWATVVLAGLLACVVLVALPVEATVVLLLAAYAVPLMWVAADLGDTRLVAPLFLLPLAAKAAIHRPSMRVDAIGLGVAILGVVYGLSSTWSGVPEKTVWAAVALLSSAALLFLIRGQLTPERVTALVRIVGASVVVISLLLAALPVGQLGGRTRGIFTNPNSLAVFLVLVVPFLFTGKWKVFGFAAFPLLVLTASRAGSVACLVEVAVLLASTWGSRGPRRVLLGTLVAGAIWLGISALQEPLTSTGTAPTLLRYEDSRSEHWQTALNLWWTAPVKGVGADANRIDAANSYLKLLTELGVVGVVAAAPLVSCLVRRFVRGTPEIAAFSAGAAVNAVFESWLFTAGSLFFLMLWLPMTYGDARSRDPLRHRVPDPATHARPRPGHKVSCSTTSACSRSGRTTDPGEGEGALTA